MDHTVRFLYNFISLVASQLRKCKVGLKDELGKTAYLMYNEDSSYVGNGSWTMSIMTYNT